MNNPNVQSHSPNDISDSKRPLIPEESHILPPRMVMMHKLPDSFDANDIMVDPFSPEARSPKIAGIKLSPLQLTSDQTGPLLGRINRGYEKNLKLMLGPVIAQSTNIKEEGDGDEEQLSTPRASRNWNKLRKAVHALLVEGKLNEFLEQKQRELEKGNAFHDIIIFKPRQLWARFKAFYINPEGWFITIWRFVFQVAIIFYSLVFPYRLAFGSEFDDTDFFNIMIYLIDAFFFADIILTFFTPIKRNDGNFTYNKKKIALVYIKSSFFLDILTILPFEVFATKAAFLKLLRIVHIGKFFEYINQFADLITPFFVSGLSLIKISDFIASITTMFLVMLLLIHFCSCIWISLGFPREDGEITWFINVEEIDDPNDPALHEGNIKIYICAIFYVVQTFATIGYGSYYGYTVREYIFSMFLLFLGTVVFAFAYEKTKAVISSFNEAHRREKQEEDELETWLNTIERNVINHKDIVQIDVLRELQAVLNYRVDEDWQKFFIGNEQFKKLDPKAAEMVLAFGLKRFKRKFYILFQDLSDPFVYRAVVQSDSRLFMPGEMIIKENKHAKGIYLILSGSVLLSGTKEDQVFRRLVSGSFFGEMCITDERKSAMNYIAETELNTLFIPREVFLELDEKYPQDIEKLSALAYFRYKHFLYQKHKRQEEYKLLGEENSARGTPRALEKELENQNVKTNPAPSDEILSNNEEESPLNEHKEKSAMLLNENGGNFQDYLSEGLSFLQNQNDQLKEKPSGHLNYGERLLALGSATSDKKGSGVSGLRMVSTFKLGAKEYKNIFQLKESNIELAQNSTESDESDEEDMTEREQAEINHHKPEENNDGEESEDDDELNSSNIYPLEIKTTFMDTNQAESYVYYLKERLEFLTEELKQLKQKMHFELHYLSLKQRGCHRRFVSLEPS